MYDQDSVSFYLECGFFPQVVPGALTELFPRLFSGSNTRNVSQESESSLVGRGLDTLISCFERVEGNEHVLPLSGGLDSRAILAGLMHAGLHKRITAVTFGSPGTYDFEIAAQIIKKYGLRHEVIDLSQIQVNTDKLLQAARDGGSRTFLFDAYYNSIVTRRFGSQVTYWSGFLGGELAGSHIPPEESTSWSQALSHFLTYNQLRHPVRLSRPGYDPRQSLPQSPIVDSGEMTYDDQLDFAIRQTNYIRRVVLSDKYDYQVPFLNPDWVDFILSIPRHLRLKKNLFKKILFELSSDLFRLPLANFNGCGLQASKRELSRRKRLVKSRKTLDRDSRFAKWFLRPVWNWLGVFGTENYLDFQDAIRTRKDFQAVVRENVQDLDRRGLVGWLDGEALFKDHLNGACNNAMGLLLLSALEISIKAEGR